MRRVFISLAGCALALALSACGGGGGGSSSSSGALAGPAAAGIATPSNVSVVTPNSN